MLQQAFSDWLLAAGRELAAIGYQPTAYKRERRTLANNANNAKAEAKEAKAALEAYIKLYGPLPI